MIRRRTLLTATGGALLGSALATGTARADATDRRQPVDDVRHLGGLGHLPGLVGERLRRPGRLRRHLLHHQVDVLQRHDAARPRPQHRPLQPGRVQLEHGERHVDGRSRPTSPRFKQIEGYWQDWNNEDPTSSAWDWTADATQRAMLVKATSRGATTRAVRQLPHVVDVPEPQPVRRLGRRQQPPVLELPPARLPPGGGRARTRRATGA